MEKVKIMKRVLIIVIGLIIALTMSNKVFAADNSSGDIFNDLTGNSSNNSSSDNTNTSNLSTTNRSVTNENTLAKTGLGESGSIITIILVISGISAVYSIKKVNEYKKL